MIREAILVVLGQRGLTARRMGSRISTPFGLSRIQTDPSLNWLPDAFAALKDALEIEPGATIDCLVLRPLGLGKILELPPARAGALRSLATTNIERLFPVTPEAWTADAQPLERPRSEPRRTLVTALPTDLLVAVERASVDAGLRVGRIVPMPAAVALHALEMVDQGHAPATSHVEYRLPGCSELVRVERGQLTGLIPSSGGEPADPRHWPGELSPDCTLAARDWVLALALAETAATGRQITQPLAQSQLAVRRRAARRRSGMLSAAAVLALLAGFGLGIVDQRRELSSLREVRVELARNVERALRQRDALNALDATVSVLAAGERARGGWLRMFQDLATALPEGAHLTHVGGRLDSLLFTVSSADATALKGLRSAPSFDVMKAEPASGSVVRFTAAWRPDSTGNGRAD